MKSSVFLLLCCLSPLLLDAQSPVNKISGQVFRKSPGGEKVVMPAGASVFIPGITSDATDNEGKYTLDLSGCRPCVPGAAVTIKVNSDYGYTEKNYTLPIAEPRPSVDIEVAENKTLSLTGIVRERVSGRAVSGVQVSALIPNYPGVIPSTTTDERGIFQIVLQKDGIVTQQAINLSIMDPSRRYNDVDQVKFVNLYEPIRIDLESSGKNQADNARSLAAEEVLGNIQHLDSRLLFIAKALKLNEKDAFSIKFDSMIRQLGPGIDTDPGSSLRKLITRSNISALRQALNGAPLRDDFGNALVETFINADMQQETPAVNLYLKQFTEVKDAEESLFSALEAYADANDTCRVHSDRIALGWATVRNRAALYHLYGLRLLDALAISSPSTTTILNALHLLTPRRPLPQKEFENYLTPRVIEMTGLVKNKAALGNDLIRCRDGVIDTGIAKINRMLTIYPTDTWQEVIIKARSLRGLGRWEDAIQAFIKYGQMFGDSDTTAIPYSRMAVRFTRQMPWLSVNGGVYLYAYTENSHIQPAGVLLGDILIELKGQKITGMDGVHTVFLDCEPGTPVTLAVLRWQEEKQTFERFEYTIPSKPMGGMFMPI